MDEKLRKLQLLEVEMLNEFVRICEKYHLTYYLFYGTLLGAVRHHGFIPWDDDMDIVMPRKDYNRFCEVAPQEVNPEYFFQNHQTDSNFPDPLSKIRKRDTIYADQLAIRMNLKSYGCWVDIYPLDNVKNPKSLKFFLRVFLGKKIAHGCSYYGAIQGSAGLTPNQKMKYHFAHIFPRKIRKMWMPLMNFLFQLDSQKETEYIMNFTGTYQWRRELIPAAWFGEPVKMEFEGKLYNVPHEWDAVLKSIYGDYMQLPPPEKRCGHPPEIWEM